MDRDKHLDITFSLLDDHATLAQDEVELLAKALEATDEAYAPFSGFLVGCALLLQDGEVILGNNQENIAYPSGMCAERTALYHAGATGKIDSIRKIAIRARSIHKEISEPVTPCGACRQVMVEYEKQTGKPYVVLMQGESGKILRLENVRNTLMPFNFNLDFMDGNPK